MYKSTFFIVLIFCFTLSSAFIQAQNETGVRFDTNYIKKLTQRFDPKDAHFKEVFPIIRSIPPISPNMPSGITTSYHFIDSLLRLGKFEFSGQYYDKWNINRDSLKLFAKMLYEMSDFNPILYNQYTDETLLYTQYPQYRHINPFYFFRNSIQSKSSLSSQLKQEQFAIYAALTSDYILRISVVSIDSTDDIVPPLDYKSYRVKAKILDTIKGRNLPIHCDSALMIKQSKIVHKNKKNKTTDCYMYFQYSPYVYEAYNESSSESRTFLKRDSVFTQFGGTFKMQKGQEAIVFLTFQNGRLDSKNDYYDISVSRHCSNGALSISNGIVTDVNKVWSPNATTSYSSWKASYRAIVDKILKGTF